MDVESGEDDENRLWPPDTLTPTQRRELCIRADTVRGLMKDRDPGPWHERSRVGAIGSKELAARFDPIDATAQHVAALLLGLCVSDAKWLFGAGIPTDLVFTIDRFAADWLAGERHTEASVTHWVTVLEKAFDVEDHSPQGDGASG